MSGDPRVLAPLQQAYLAADDGSNARTYIRYSWRAATNQHGLPWHQVDAEIRAWTPPPAEPSLDERLDIYGRDINELAATSNDHMLELAELKESIERLKNQQTLDCKHTGIALTDLDRRLTVQENKKPEQHPEPTAPDLDPVLRDGREQAIKQQAIVTVLQRYRHLTSFFDKSSLNRMALEMLQEMDKDGGA